MQPGDKLDRYMLEARIGAGGMGEVFAARDTRLGRRVALKRILGEASPTAKERLLREARAAAAFEHPNAVVIYDVGEWEGAPYLAMELIRGKALRGYVRDESIPVPRRIRWLIDVARALGAAHRAGLIHRDVKPDNVMIREDGAVKVLDFGLARRTTPAIDPNAPTADLGDADRGVAIQTITAEGVLLATPVYAAPEQLRREDLDGRADQFSWAVMGYELLSGELPWNAGDTVGVIAQILSSEPPALTARAPDVPEKVEEILRRALEKRADDRFATIDEAADALDPFAEARLEPSVPRPGGAVLTPERVSVTPAARQAAVSAPSKSVETPAPVGTTGERPARRPPRRGAWLFLGISMLSALLTIGALAVRPHLRSSPVTAAPDAAAPPVVAAIGCRDAALTGASAAPDLARAIGIGACARLAAELAVDWGTKDAAEALAVSGKIEVGAAEVSLSIAGRTASGKGATPIEAVNVAVAAMGTLLTPPPRTPEQIQAWGAADAAGARRIERVWRRVLLHADESSAADIQALRRSDPESPWPYVIAALTSTIGAQATAEARQRAMELAARLPPSRARAVRGILLFQVLPADINEGQKLLRQAYAEAPDDPDIAALCGMVALEIDTLEEGLAITDRLATRFPSRSLLPLAHAINPKVAHDLTRDQRFLDRLHATLPESAAWGPSVEHLVLLGRFDEARAAIDFARRLGLSIAVTDAARVELASLNPKAAREMGQQMLGDPSDAIVADGANLIQASYQMEGRLIDADSALIREVERLRRRDNPWLAATLEVQDLHLRRLAGREIPARIHLDDIERDVEAGAGAGDVTMARGEIALARMRGGKLSKAGGQKVLAGIEALADKRSGGERTARDSLLLTILPLTRAVRGDVAAVKQWRELDRAIFIARRLVALDAALALEAAGDKEEAEKAYLLAEDAVRLDSNCSAFAAMAARVRLVKLYRDEGRSEDAAKVEAEVARVWAGADPGLREAVLKMK